MKKILVCVRAAAASGRRDWRLGFGHVRKCVLHAALACRTRHVTVCVAKLLRTAWRAWRCVACVSCMPAVSPIVARQLPPAEATVFWPRLPHSHRGLARTTFDRLAIHLPELSATRSRIPSQNGSPWCRASCDLYACRSACCITGPSEMFTASEAGVAARGVGFMLPPCVLAQRVARPPAGLGGHRQHSHGSLTRRLLHRDRLCSAATLVKSPADHHSVITRAAHHGPTWQWCAH